MLRSAQVIVLLCGGSAELAAAGLSCDILRQLPQGYSVLASAISRVGARQFHIVALRSRKELASTSYLSSADQAPDRPLLIFELRRNGQYISLGRNDKVIATADGAGLAGNGCDPFEDHQIAVKGPYFTIENDVSCGAHWTDYITFRFDARMGKFVFDNERFQSWKLDPNDNPNSEALIPDVQRVRRALGGKPVTFSDWQPLRS